MITNTDKDGEWEVSEGVGCTNKRLITPSAQYLIDHPTPTAEEMALAEKQEAVNRLIDGGEYALPEVLSAATQTAAEINCTIMCLYEELMTAFPDQFGV